MIIQLREKYDMNRAVIFYAISALAISSQANAALSNFVITNNGGTLYEVDGTSLQATQIAQIEGGQNTSDIVYIGGGDILVNGGGGFARYNIATGSQEIEFVNRQDFPNPALVDFANGAALTTDGNVYFTVLSAFENGITPTRGMLYNPSTREFTHLATLEDSKNTQIYYHDYHEIGENLFLSADGINPKLRVYNSLTGALEYEYDSTEGFVTFVELDRTLYGLTRTGSMYSIDESTGSTEYHGQVTGVANSVFGATLPSPSTVFVLGTAFGISARRRR